jgi:hypothetical protein
LTPVVRFEPEASEELFEAANWYEDRRVGLGFDFLAAVDRTVGLVQRWPHAAPSATHVPIGAVIRRAPIGRFPYRLVYLQVQVEIRVLAVAYEARRPWYWLARLPK